MTEITSYTGVTVISSGNTLPELAVLSLPVTSVDDFEAYEGMYVTFPQALFISEYYNFDRFNEIVLTSERHLTPTAEFDPGPDAIQRRRTSCSTRSRLTMGARPESGSGDPPERIGVRSNEPVPRRRHGRGRDRRDGLLVQPVPYPADPGSGLHQSEPAHRQPRRCRGQLEGRIVQRVELLHDTRRQWADLWARRRIRIVAERTTLASSRGSATRSSLRSPRWTLTLLVSSRSRTIRPMSRRRTS